jgi:hypothetical protein
MYQFSRLPVSAFITRRWNVNRVAFLAALSNQFDHAEKQPSVVPDSSGPLSQNRGSHFEK